MFRLCGCGKADNILIMRRLLSVRFCLRVLILGSRFAQLFWFHSDWGFWFWAVCFPMCPNFFLYSYLPNLGLVSPLHSVFCIFVTQWSGSLHVFWQSYLSALLEARKRTLSQTQIPSAQWVNVTLLREPLWAALKSLILTAIVLAIWAQDMNLHYLLACS